VNPIPLLVPLCEKILSPFFEDRFFAATSSIDYDLSPVARMAKGDSDYDSDSDPDADLSLIVRRAKGDIDPDGIIWDSSGFYKASSPCIYLIFCSSLPINMFFILGSCFSKFFT